MGSHDETEQKTVVYLEAESGVAIERREHDDKLNYTNYWVEALVPECLRDEDGWLLLVCDPHFRGPIPLRRDEETAELFDRLARKRVRNEIGEVTNSVLTPVQISEAQCTALIDWMYTKVLRLELDDDRRKSVAKELRAVARLAAEWDVDDLRHFAESLLYDVESGYPAYHYPYRTAIIFERYPEDRRTHGMASQALLNVAFSEVEKAMRKLKRKRKQEERANQENGGEPAAKSPRHEPGGGAQDLIERLQHPVPVEDPPTANVNAPAPASPKPIDPTVFVSANPNAAESSKAVVSVKTEAVVSSSSAGASRIVATPPPPPAAAAASGSSPEEKKQQHLDRRRIEDEAEKAASRTRSETELRQIVMRFKLIPRATFDVHYAGSLSNFHCRILKGNGRSCSTKLHDKSAFISRHWLSHLGVKPYWCFVCGQRAQQNYNMNNICTEKGKSFHLKSHLREEGGIPDYILQAFRRMSEKSYRVLKQTAADIDRPFDDPADHVQPRVHMADMTNPADGEYKRPPELKRFGIEIVALPERYLNRRK